MAEDANRIVKRKNDDIDSEEDLTSNHGSDDGSDIGDPWQEMNEEDELKQQQDREARRKAKQQELLGIDEDHLKWDDETGLVVPIKNLVNFAGRGRDIKERRQSAFGFAHFSTEESSQKQIAEFQNDYGIDALLSLLESDDNICRRYSALALGNIVSNNKFAIKCIEFGVLEAMLPLAVNDETDLETRRYCMLAVANMAANNITHSTILKQLEDIIILIDSSDEEIQKCSTLCLQNLSANKDIVMELELSIQPLVNLISINKGKHIPLPDSKLHSVAALRGLCIADVLRLKIINEGILRAFLHIIDKPPNSAILVEISAILCGFSSLYETHIDLLQPAVLHSIFLLAMGDIVEAQQFGSTTLANLASNSSNHDKLIEANAICNLLIMCDYSNNKVKSSATRALANFASNSNRHELLLDEGCLKVMIRTLNCSDSYNNMYSALFFSILCENNTLHQILSIPEIIQPLFHLIVLDTALTETIRYSVLALANLANSGQSHPFILSEIEIQLNSFFNLSNNNDIETQRYFGLLLSNLGENINSHNLLSTPIALSKILILFKSNEIEVILNCLSYLLKLLCTKKDSIRCRISNMFSKLITNLINNKWKNNNEELLFMISAYFSNITTSEEVRKNLYWDDIVILLGNLLRENKNEDIQIYCINGLANLRDVNNAVNIMVETEMLSLILDCIQSSIIDIHSSALRLMSGISSHKLSINKLIDLNMIHLIGPFVRSPHSAFRKYAYICLANYASHENGKIDLNDVNLIKCYLNTSIDEKADIEEMRCCLFALANTSYHIENKEIISESGVLIIKTLMDYININDEIIKEYASLLLSNLSVLLPSHCMFGYHDIILMIIKLASTIETTKINPTTILQSIKCLRNLSFYDEHIHILLECQIIDFIVKFINERKTKNYHEYSPFIDKQIAGLCYNLSSHPISIKYIARNDLILSVTSLLISNESETRQNAARSLTSIAMHTNIATPLFLENEETLQYILSALKFNNDLDLYHSLSIILGYVFSLKQIQNGKSYKITRTHILSLLRKSNRQIQLAALWATSTGSENVIMKDDEMLNIISKLAEPQLPPNDNENENNNNNNESPLLLKTIRRRALITLVNYAQNEENHKLIISNCSNVITNAFNLKDCNDIDVILLSAMLLSNLSNSLNNEIHNTLISNHDIATLDLYLGYENINIQIFATRALSNICNTPKFAKNLILSEKIIPLLCLTTLKGHLFLNQEIASFFQNLTRHIKFIPMILEQHLIPTLIELLKINNNITIRIRIIKALQNCCCSPSTLQRIIEVENGIPFLWNLLLKFSITTDPNDIENTQFISCVIKILSLFTQIKNCKYQFLCGLYNNLNFDDTLAIIIENKKSKKIDNCIDKKPALPKINRGKKCLEDMEIEFKSDEYAQTLCKNRLKALLSIMLCAEMDEKLLIIKILKVLSGLPELHSIWMSEKLENKSLSYLTIYCLFLILNENKNCFELIEITLTVLSQLLLYKNTVSKLLEFDEIQNKFNIINELQKYGNHEWISIRTLSVNITAYLMEHIQHLIAINTEKKMQYFEYFKNYFCEPNNNNEQLNGFSLIKLNGKISDIRLQAQIARLLAIFSSIKEYIEWLNNDNMYALLFLLAEQSWRIGGDTEIKPVTTNSEEKPESNDDKFLMTLNKDTHIIHESVITCLSNMIIELKTEFIPESTNLMPAILRYVKDRNLEIRSLAFTCIAGTGQRGVSPLFYTWEDPIAMIVKTLNECNENNNKIITINVQCNIMKAFILLSENVNHLDYILQKNENNDSIFKLLIQYAQSNDSYVRLLALTALTNIISFNEWQENGKNDEYGNDLIKMLRYLFNINKNNKQNIKSIQNYTTQNRCNRHSKIEELLLLITSYIAKIKRYQKKLLIGDKPNIVESLNNIIINNNCLLNHSFLCSLTLYHLSQNKELLINELLIDEKCIESSLYITLNNINSLKHCYVSLSTIANLCILNNKHVINGRDYYLTTQHKQIINNQPINNKNNKFPLFALETLHKISFDLNNKNNNNCIENNEQYSLSNVHSLISLIASRITSHKQFELNSMDLCYLNTIIYYLSSSNFYTQIYSLITFLNFMSKSTKTIFHKIISSKSWISILLSLIESTNLSVKNIVLKCILKIIDENQNENETENENKPLRNKLENKPQLLRFLDELFCNSHFPSLIDLSFQIDKINKFTLIAISRILLILSENMPITTLLMNRNNGQKRNELLSALIEFTLNPNKEIKLNGAASISCFLSSHSSQNIPFKILHSSQNGIDINSNNNRGLIAFYEMITNKQISTFCNKNRYLNANNIESHKSIGYTVIIALSSLSNNIQFTKQFLNTQNGLSIITNQILNGIAFESFEAAQILRNVCKEKENIKQFLNENGCKCLLKFISSKSMQLKFLAAATLADIIYYATTPNANNNDDNLFVLTTEHLSPYMTTITDCLLVLLQSDCTAIQNAINIPTVKTTLNNNKNKNNNNDFNGRKLVRICLGLLYRLCKDSDNCKKLIVESGAIKPLCNKYKEFIKYKYSEIELILNILKYLSTFKDTQIQFIEQNGDNILNILVNQHTNNNDLYASQIISSLSKNIQTHKLIAIKKIYSLLLTLRHSQNAEARKLSMDTLLTFLENQNIYQYVKTDVDLAQTLAAISKFGASKHIKLRSTKIIKNMLGTKAYLNITQNNNNNNNNTHKFAKPKVIKSAIMKSPKTQKNNGKKNNIIKTETISSNDNSDNKEKKMEENNNDKENESMSNKENESISNKENESMINNEKPVDFWHDDEEQTSDKI